MNQKNIISFMIFGLILGFCATSGVVLGDGADSTDAKILLMNALNRSDSLILLEDSDKILENNEGILIELEMAKDILENQPDNDSSLASETNTLEKYVEFWILFETAYGNMIMGSDMKKQGYDALSEKKPDSFSDAYEHFTGASRSYQNAYDTFREAKEIIPLLDQVVISGELPNATIPKEHVVDEIYMRLKDNIEICSAYSHICKSEMILSDAGNTTTPAVKDERNVGIQIMRSLISSPYVGYEAAVISNISVFQEE